MMRLPALTLLLFLLSTGCSVLPGGGEEQTAADTTRAPGVPPPGEGLVTTTSTRSVAATAERLKSALRKASGVSIIADIDHAAHAGSDSLLRPMRLLLFGNPRLGTPLMQKVQSAGIDLPQKMLIWRGEDDSTRVTYNAPVYLEARHDLSGVSASLSKMEKALAGFAQKAAGQVPDTAAFNADSIDAGGGLVVKISDFGFDKTLRRLKSAVQSRSSLSLMAELDHAANAMPGSDSLRSEQNGEGDTSSARAEGRSDSTDHPRLRPTHLLVAGNPEAGTPLMRKAPTMGIDLPQKLLVYEGAERGVFVVYNDPAYLARRHTLSSDSTRLARIGQTLEDLTMQATADEQEEEDLREAKQDTTGIAF